MTHFDFFCGKRQHATNAVHKTFTEPVYGQKKFDLDGVIMANIRLSML